MKAFQYFLKFQIVLALTMPSISFSQSSEEIKKLSSLQNKQLLDQLTEVQEKNKYTQVLAVQDAIHFSQQAALKYEHGNECQLSCPDGCCDSGAGLMYEGGLFMVLNKQATNQAKASEISARQACVAANQLSAGKPKDCSIEVKAFDITKPDTSWYDSAGKCKTSAPTECGMIASMPGASVFGSATNNCKKMGTCQDDFYSTYKANPDGSVQFKVGNRSIKLTMDSFKDKDALIAAGVSFEYADSLMNRFKSAEKMLPSRGQSAHSLNPNQAQTEQTALTAHQNSNAGDSVGLNQNSGSAGYPTRSLSSTGPLTVNYNGEAIHINSTDLFKVISSRYNANIPTLLPAE